LIRFPLSTTKLSFRCFRGFIINFIQQETEIAVTLKVDHDVLCSYCEFVAGQMKTKIYYACVIISSYSKRASHSLDYYLNDRVHHHLVVNCLLKFVATAFELYRLDEWFYLKQSCMVYFHSLGHSCHQMSHHNMSQKLVTKRVAGPVNSLDYFFEGISSNLFPETMTETNFSLIIADFAFVKFLSDFDHFHISTHESQYPQTVPYYHSIYISSILICQSLHLYLMNTSHGLISFEPNFALVADQNLPFEPTYGNYEEVLLISKHLN